MSDTPFWQWSAAEIVAATTSGQISASEATEAGRYSEGEARRWSEASLTSARRAVADGHGYVASTRFANAT